MSEADNPKTTFIFLAVVATVVLLGAIVLAVDQFFGVSVREEIAQKLLKPQSSALRQLRSEEEAKLTRYQWADQKAGVLRIPVDRAAELILAEWSARPQGFVAPVADAPPPAGQQVPPAGAGSPQTGGATSGQEGTSKGTGEKGAAEVPAPGSKK